jgi:transposase
MINQVRELAAQKKPIRKISLILGISRNTVRQYLRQDSAEPDQTDPQLSHWSNHLPWDEIAAKRIAGYQIDQLHKTYGPEAASYWAFNRLLKKKMLADPSHQVTIVQKHLAGEKVQIDYTDGLLVFDRATGKSRKTHLFVGVMAFSSYTFGTFCFDQKLPNFLRCQEAMWRFFGGVTPYVVPDNLRSAVSKAHRYDPDINPSYCDFANHWGFGVIPARPYKPRDKGLVEATIGAIQRSFFQEYRDKTFYSLDELNRDFRIFLDQFNQKIMKDYGTSRLARFQAEKDKLLPLARNSFEIAEWKEHKVHPDCHVQIQHCYYSVPFRYVGQMVRAKITDRVVEVFSSTLEPIAFHSRITMKGCRATVEAHLPEEKLQACQFEIIQAVARAKAIGPGMLELMEKIFGTPRPLVGLRKAQGILRCWGKDGVDNEAMEYAAGQCLTFAKIRTDFFRDCALSFQKMQARGSKLAPVRNNNNVYVR